MKHFCALQSTKGAVVVSLSMGLVLWMVSSLPRAMGVDPGG